MFDEEKVAALEDENHFRKMLTKLFCRTLTIRVTKPKTSAARHELNKIVKCKTFMSNSFESITSKVFVLLVEFPVNSHKSLRGDLTALERDCKSS